MSVSRAIIAECDKKATEQAALPCTTTAALYRHLHSLGVAVLIWRIFRSTSLPLKPVMSILATVSRRVCTVINFCFAKKIINK